MLTSLLLSLEPFLWYRLQRRRLLFRLTDLPSHCDITSTSLYDYVRLNNIQFGVEEYSEGQEDKFIVGRQDGSTGGKKLMLLLNLFFSWFLTIFIIMPIYFSFLLSFTTKEYDS